MNELVKINENNQPTTTSKIIADTFHKVHRDVIRAINNLNIPEDFRMRNFAQSKFKADNVNGMEYECYEITRDGFTLLAMGFTGKKAIEWKVKYIQAFNAMEAKLKELSNVPAPVDMKAIGGVVKKCAAVAVRDELKAVIHDEFQYFVMRTFAAAEDLKPFQQVTDDMLLHGLYDWYSTKHHEHIQAIKDLTAENDRLKSKMATIRQTAAE